MHFCALPTLMCNASYLCLDLQLLLVKVLINSSCARLEQIDIRFKKCFVFLSFSQTFDHDQIDWSGIKFKMAVRITARLPDNQRLTLTFLAEEFNIIVNESQGNLLGLGASLFIALLQVICQLQLCLLLAFSIRTLALHINYQEGVVYKDREWAVVNELVNFIFELHFSPNKPMLPSSIHHI